MIFDKVAVASDHRGVELKARVCTYLTGLGFSPADLGTSSSEISVDYPDYAAKVCDFVASHENSFGILICHSGIGMSIAANRYKSIRAVLCSNETMAQLSREHNNANVICFGAGFVDVEVVFRCLKTFCSTSFNERHLARIQKLDTLTL